MPGLVKRTRCARVIVVTGTPHAALIDAARRIRGTGLGVTVVRVAAPTGFGYDGLDVVDLTDAADLTEQLT
jgi:hypothetical protein